MTKGWKPRPLPRLDQHSQSVPKGFETLLRTMPGLYREEADRARMRSGIVIDPSSSLSFEDAVIFVWIVACMAMWISKFSPRADLHRDARSQSRLAWRRHQKPEAHVKKTTFLYGPNGLKQTEALAALGFALNAGYPTHSWTLWQSLDAALTTDGLAPRYFNGRLRGVSDAEQVELLFKSIGDRLRTASRKSDAAALHRKALDTWLLLRDMPFGGSIKNRWARPSTWDKRFGET